MLSTIVLAASLSCPTVSIPEGWILDGYKIEWLTQPEQGCLSLALGAFEFDCYLLESAWEETYNDLCGLYDPSDPALVAALAAADAAAMTLHSALLDDLANLTACENP